MVYLTNYEAYTSFVYHTSKGRYLRESDKVVWWAKSSLGYEEWVLPNLKTVNLIRKVLDKLPANTLEAMTLEDTKNYVASSHPEYFI